ncbi:hypothetical protein HOLleu_42579 [Holothuria leucospilota]|uniref:Uncharacterized protein n=1 Tax=Holothuria leucospilota TaxID=206669 RepID=A0A9Q1B9A3_HOLLE|nr:hypothetical protein HOLleu_42579 [Holothuria leucospilota]
MVLRGAETRTHTEKGLQWQIGQKSGKFRKLVATWRSQAGKIECMLTENDNPSDVREARNSLQNVMTEISGVYNDLDALLAETNEQGSKYEKFEEIESEHYSLIKRVSKIFLRD